MINFSEASKYMEEVFNSVLEDGVKKATKYVSNKFVIKVTKRNTKTLTKRDTRIEFIVTIGMPNYEEREFIKLLKETKSTYPVKKVQIKFYKKAIK